MKLKTKLSLGVSFLFVVIVVFGILGIFYITRLSNDSAKVLTNNHESLVYCNNMLKALEDIPVKPTAEKEFDTNLRLQENNITEQGEAAATIALRRDFTELLADKNDQVNYVQLRQGIQQINDLNQQAILKKNASVQAYAQKATFWLSFIFCVLIIVTLTFSYNFPAIIASPITRLTGGIRAIADKDYKKRIFLDQKDEFGEMATAFNTMAEKLDEYEHSNLAQLRFEKSRIETIINQMKDAVIGLDNQNRLLFLNAVAEGLLGLDEKTVAGKYAPDIALQNDLLRTLLQDDEKKELKIYADNKESYFNKDLLNVNSNGKVIGKVIVLKNITPFHELSEAKTNFIATVSHELKTPISSIKMSARLLRDERTGIMNTEQQEFVDSIADDAERLLKITSELLNLSQAETGNIQLHLQPTAPASIVEEAQKATEFKARQKRITVAVMIESDIPFVIADKEKTSWVLINFLTNAIKYSPHNSRVDIKITAENKSIRFEVYDKGIGIEAQYIPRIFDRYFKIPGHAQESDTGLGLAISREFIEAEGGVIQVKSTYSEGSCFSFLLPQA